MEEKIFFASGSYQIEGRIERQSEDVGVVITHPHPLYGGDMNNYVVKAITDAFRQKGYTTLRFNFRGAGRSQGRYADGIGEQEDVKSAISYLNEIGIEKVDLAGYSFGAWINALSVNSGVSVRQMVMVSPPLGFIDFKDVAALPCLKLVVTGSTDNIAPEILIKKMLPIWNPETQFEVISGADHFYGGYTDDLESVLLANL